MTYKGVPLYRFVGDHKAGQATGNIKDTWGEWWVDQPREPADGSGCRPFEHREPTPTTVASSGAAY